MWYLICSSAGKGGGYAGLDSLTSFPYSPYSSDLFVLGGGGSASKILLCVRVCA